MRRVSLLLLLACGQPEDLLVIEGRAVTSDGGDATGIPLMLSRDLGATENGCTAFSPWQYLTAGDGGVVRIEHLRAETQGRFALPRCLRLSWSFGERTNSLSWFSRERDTQLPVLPVPFDDLSAAPQLMADNGGVTPPLPSFELKDDRGVFWRQAFDTDPALALDGVGPQPATGSTLVSRLIQRGQKRQTDALGQEPLLQFEYRQQIESGPVDGNAALLELGHGSPCNVRPVGSNVCLLTDGLFEPVTVNQAELIIELPSRPAVRTVVVRGVGTRDPLATLVVQGAIGMPDAGWIPAARISVDWTTQLLTTSSLEDPLPAVFVVAHWTGPAGPIAAVRVSVENADGVDLPIAWVGEVSIY